MNARKLSTRNAAVWLVGAMLALFAVMLIGGCRERRGFARHEPDIYVASHGDYDRVVLVEHQPRRARMTLRRRERDRRNDRRRKEEARHDRRDRKDDRRTDRRDDDRPRPRRR